MNEIQKIDDHIGTCALCESTSVTLRESHSIPKFAYQWMKDTSPTPYLRSSDNINAREQDGPKEYLLCDDCERDLSDIETELAEKLFKKVANYRQQKDEIRITDKMRIAVLSIFWRALVTTLGRESGRTEEDELALQTFLSSAKEQIRSKLITTRIYIAPVYGDPPFYELPVQITYLLDRMTGAQDVRFFDDPHRYFAVFKLPFIFFYIPMNWREEELDPNAEFIDQVKMSEIRTIPDFLRSYILWLADQFRISDNKMTAQSREIIARDISKSKDLTGSHKSLARSQQPKP